MRLTLVLLAAFPALLGAQSASRAAARADNGFSAERLQCVDVYLQQQVDSNRVAGVVGLVLRDGKVVYERAVGWADKESGRRMTTDAMFRIASQTKALPSIAIMILFEEGKIALNNPVRHGYTATTPTFSAASSKSRPASHSMSSSERASPGRCA